MPNADPAPSDSNPPLLPGAERLYPRRFVLLAAYLFAVLATCCLLVGTGVVMGSEIPWPIVFAGLLVLTALQAAFLSGAPHFRWPRPTGRRPMLLSLLAGAAMAALLSLGVAGTAVSFLRADDFVGRVDQSLGGPPTLVVAFWVLSWVGWLVVFTLGWAGEWLVRFRRMYRLLFAGSWLELLVTIPVDVQVRKRTKCYCGEGTFFALVIGITAALWAFGPGLVMLFLTRRLQRRADLNVCRGCGYDLRGLTESRCPECGRPFDPRRLATKSADAAVQ